jgi:ketosteroid isomerase-like protein
MRSFPRFALVSVLALGASPCHAGEQVDAGFFGDLISRRLQAVAEGDARAYMEFIHPDLVHVDDHGTRRRAAEMPELVTGAAGMELLRKRFDVSDVHASRHGDLVFVDALVTETHDIAGRSLQGRMRESDVLKQEDGRWLFWRHHETLLPATVQAVRAETDASGDYVGRYEYWPGWAENIHARDGALWIEFVGEKDPPVPLIQLSDATYVLPEDPSRMFLRDRSGTVIGYQEIAPDGSLTFARRLP